MAQGTKTKEETVCELMNAPKEIDTSVNIKIPRSVNVYDPAKHKYKCSCCGAPFNTLKGNFHKSNSPLFQANEGYLPWCTNCTDTYWNGLVALYDGNEAHATEHFCQQVDWVYDINPYSASKDAFSGHRDRSLISHYSARKNLNCGGRKTFIDTIKYNYENQLGNVITSKEQTKSEDVSVTATAIDRWGVGFAELDYKNLEDHYRMLKRNNPNADNNQEIFIKTLCNLNMLMIRALLSGNSKEYGDLSEKYSKTFKDAGLRTVAEKDSSNDETFCMTLGLISDYTPEEFYKDKELYKDFDKIGEYMERHITRPMINLETGSNTRDNEFFVPDGDEVDDYEEE